MKFCLSLLSFLFISPVFSQYYYKDIIGAKESNDLVRIYRSAGVRSVLVKSYDGSNQRIEDLVLQQQYSPTSRVLTTRSQSAQSGQSVLKSFFDESGKLVKAIDSSSLAIWTTSYGYTPAGKLSSLIITSTDSTRDFMELEEHYWQYLPDGKPARLLKIKNKVDTSFVELKLDANGNVVEEQEKRKNKVLDPVYYYYDENNRLTDIVRFNAKANRLLPEYLFEYSAKDQVIQRITVPANSSEYIIWRYQYDEKGLKTREAVYNKQKQLTGRIEYEYGFGS